MGGEVPGVLLELVGAGGIRSIGQRRERRIQHSRGGGVKDRGLGGGGWKWILRQDIRDGEK